MLQLPAAEILILPPVVAPDTPAPPPRPQEVPAPDQAVDHALSEEEWRALNLHRPATSQDPVLWGSTRIYFDTWPPEGACVAADATHSWAYMVLLSDACGADLFPHLPRPQGLLMNAPGTSWSDWVVSLRHAMEALGIGGLQWLLDRMDSRCHIPRESQEHMLRTCATDFPEPTLPFPGQGSMPWTHAFAAYITQVHQDACLAHADMLQVRAMTDARWRPTHYGEGLGGPAACWVQRGPDIPGQLCNFQSRPEGSAHLVGNFGCRRLLTADTPVLVFPRSACIAECRICLDCVQGREWVGQGFRDAADVMSIPSSVLSAAYEEARPMGDRAPFPLWLRHEDSPPCFACVALRPRGEQVDQLNYDEGVSSHVAWSLQRRRQVQRPPGGWEAHCFPCSEVEQDTTCMICMDQEGADWVSVACCSGYMHRECAGSAIMVTSVCPYCRAPWLCRDLTQGPHASPCRACSDAEAGSTTSPEAISSRVNMLIAFPGDTQCYICQQPFTDLAFDSVPCCRSLAHLACIAATSMCRRCHRDPRRVPPPSDPSSEPPPPDPPPDPGPHPPAHPPPQPPPGAPPSREGQGGQTAATGVTAPSGRFYTFERAQQIGRRMMRGRQPAPYQLAEHGVRVECPYPSCSYAHGAATVIRHLRAEHPALALSAPADLFHALDAVSCSHCDMPYPRSSLAAHYRTHGIGPAPITPAQAAFAPVVRPAAEQPAVNVPGGAPASSWDWLWGLTVDQLLDSVSTSRELIPTHLQQLQADCQSKFRIAMAAEDERTQTLGHKLGWLFGTAVLSGRGRGGASGNKELASRMTRFLRGDWEALWSERIRPMERHAREGDGASQTRQVAKAVRSYHEGRVAEAMRILTRASMAPCSLETLEALIKLHPTGADVELPPLIPGIEIDPATLRKVIMQAPPHRMPGADGIRYEHLKTELKMGDADALLKSLLHLVAGRLPPVARELHAICVLLALLKANGGVRPLGVGTTFRRTGAAGIMLHMGSDLEAFFSDEGAAQFAVGTRSGAEAQVHLTRSTLCAHPDWLTISMDQVNAFNTVNRKAFIDGLHVSFPELLPFVAQFYGAPSSLVYRLDSPWPEDVPLPGRLSFVGDARLQVALQSLEGCQQGDPMGTFLYSLSIQPILREAAALFPEVDLSAFADDGRVTGPPEPAIRCWVWLREKLAPIGLVFKPSASLAWCPQPLPAAIQAALAAESIKLAPPDEGFGILGTCIGAPEWCSQWVQDKCAGCRTDLAKVASMPAGEAQDGLLRYCASSWLLFLARGLPPNIAAELIDHDVSVQDIFFRGAGAAGVGAFAQAVAQLPLSWGGFGMEPTHKIAPRAYLGSWLAVKGKLARLYTRFREWNESNPTSHPGVLECCRELTEAVVQARDFIARAEASPDKSCLSFPAHLKVHTALDDMDLVLRSVVDNTANLNHAQKRCAVALHLRTLEEAVSSASLLEASILHGAATKGAMSWLVPTIHDHLRLPNPDYIMVKQLHLGLPFVGLPVVHQCDRCLQELDGSTESLIKHAASKGHLSNQYLHNPVVKQLTLMCTLQGHTARAGGEGGALGQPHSADLQIFNFDGPGRHVRVDVKTGWECGVQALRTNGPAAREYTAHREATCHLEHAPFDVVPFVITATGQIGAEAEALIHKVHKLSGGRIAGGIDPTASVPNAEFYWHRRIRVFLLLGMCGIIRTVTGVPVPVQGLHDVDDDFVPAEVARLSALVDRVRSERREPSEASTVLAEDSEPGEDSDEEDSDVDDALDQQQAGLAATRAPSAQEQAVRRAALSIGSCCPGLFQPEGAVCLGCGGVVGPPRAAAPLEVAGDAPPGELSALEDGPVPAEGLLGAEGAGVAPGGVEVAAPSPH